MTPPPIQLAYAASRAGRAWAAMVHADQAVFAARRRLAELEEQAVTAREEWVRALREER